MAKWIPHHQVLHKLDWAQKPAWPIGQHSPLFTRIQRMISHLKFCQYLIPLCSYSHHPSNWMDSLGRQQYPHHLQPPVIFLWKLLLQAWSLGSLEIQPLNWAPSLRHSNKSIKNHTHVSNLSSCSFFLLIIQKITIQSLNIQQTLKFRWRRNCKWKLFIQPQQGMIFPY